MAFLPNLFGCLTHLGGRDTRVPVLRRFAAMVGYANGSGLVLSMRFGDPAVGGYADATDRRAFLVNSVGVLADRPFSVSLF
ncbi:MAG: hypothetical protein LBQ66_14780 [Planctomycetaceae bacterium]|nr:hypothetical protein [Planctomycetaceae bacterium]